MSLGAIERVRTCAICQLVAVVTAAVLAFGFICIPAYAEVAVSGALGTCRWEISDDGVLTIYPGTLPRDCGTPWRFYDEYDWGWDIRELVVAREEGAGVVASGSLADFFVGLENLERADCSGLDTSQVTDMSEMFSECHSLTSLDVSGWDTSQVMNMRAMFFGCRSLASLDVSGWDTSHVTDMSAMFSGCSSLTSLDVSDWDTSSVTRMSYVDSGEIQPVFGMFSGCISLAYLDVSSWDTSLVTDMNGMFSDCYSIASLDVSGWDTSQTVNMGCLFNGCSSLSSLDVAAWDTSRVGRMDFMFAFCSSLPSIDVSSWNTSSVGNMDAMFYGCSSLASLDVSGWDTSSARIVESMFSECKSLVRFSVGEHYNIASVPYPRGDKSLYWLSTKTGEVFTTEQIIAARGGVADTYEFVDANGLAAAVIDPIGTQVFTGSAVTPPVTVRMDGIILRLGDDYTVAYENNIKAGIATVRVTGKGDYVGTRIVTFEIAVPFFSDFSPSDDVNHGLEVNWLGTSGISTGWEVSGGREFRGLRDIARCDFAAFLYRLGDLSDDGKRNDSIRLSEARTMLILAAVSDCNTSTPYAAEIAWLVDSGISRGWQDKGKSTVSFRPMAKVARQDMAAFLYRFADMQDDGKQNSSPSKGTEKVKFTDVKSGDVANHANEVEWLASVGITKGWSNGDSFEFRGVRTVARQDMAAFIYRLNNYLS